MGTHTQICTHTYIYLYLDFHFFQAEMMELYRQFFSFGNCKSDLCAQAGFRGKVMIGVLAMTHLKRSKHVLGCGGVCQLMEVVIMPKMFGVVRMELNETTIVKKHAAQDFIKVDSSFEMPFCFLAVVTIFEKLAHQRCPSL